MVYLIVEVPDLPDEHEWALILRRGKASILAVKDIAREADARAELRAAMARHAAA